MWTIIKAFLGPIGTWLAGAGIIVTVIGGIYTKGHLDGSASMKAKWDAAIAADIAKVNKARKDAEKQVDDTPEGEKRDPNNRDNQ